MDKLDRAIEEALSAEDRAILDETAELGYFAQGVGLFVGRTSWVNWVVIIVQATLFFIAVWAGWHFFTATELLPALKWGVSAATLALMAMVLKLSLMPVMQANRVIRELKRVELMLAAREK